MALIQCPECGSTISDRAANCPKCGTPLQPQVSPQNSVQSGGAYVSQVYSTTPPRPALSPEQDQYLDKFHWGAFSFSAIWALCNDLVLYGLLAIVISIFTGGIGGWIACFLFGFKGTRWAWEKSKAKSFEEFAKTQDSWDKWGKIIFMISAISISAVFAGLVAGNVVALLYGY